MFNQIRKTRAAGSQRCHLYTAVLLLLILSTSAAGSQNPITATATSSDSSSSQDAPYVVTTETYTATRQTVIRGTVPPDVAAATQLAATAALGQPVQPPQQQQQQQQAPANAQPEAAVAAPMDNIVAAVTPAIPAGSSPRVLANITAKVQKSNGTQPDTAKKWKPTYPFPQCVDKTLSYDVSFVGKLQVAQVGSVRYAYHRFGPLRPDMVKQERASAPKSGVYASVAAKAPAPVLFISGWGLTMYMWPIPLLQRLAESREVVIFDNMRTGLSIDNSTAPLSIPAMANSTAALITKLGLQTPDVWSWSIGAFVGYGLLAFHPNKIGNVVITSGSPGGPDALLPPEPVTQQIASLGQNYTALLPYLFAKGVKDDGVCSFYAAYNSFYNSQHTSLSTPLGLQSLLTQSQAAVKFFMDPTIINKLGSTPNRVLILHGVQDKLVPVRNALLGAWKLLGAWMLQFPGEGHALPFSNVQAVITATLQFLGYANPLTRDEMKTWSHYGGTAASRMLNESVTLVVRAEAVGKK